MNKKIITIVSIIVFVAFTGVVFWNVEKSDRQERQNLPIVQNESEKGDQNMQTDEARKPQIQEIKPINLQTVQPQSEDSDEDNQTNSAQEPKMGNWLTYASENEQFTIKYPSDLFIKAPARENNSSIFSSIVALVISDEEDMAVQAIDPSESVHIVILISKKKEGQDLRQHVYGMAAGEEEFVTEVIVNGNDGFRVLTDSSSSALLYFFSKDDQIYTLTGVNYLEGGERVSSYKRMEEIISTFDFF